MTKEYLEAQFRRYFRDATAVEAILATEDDETTTVLVTQGFNTTKWVCEPGSDDDFFVFNEVTYGEAMITVPFEAEPVEPLWRTGMFTDAERRDMVIMMEEEVRGSLNEYATEILDDHELVDLIAYVDDDPEETVDMLKAIIDCNAGMDDYESGEHESHVTQASFMRRFKLVDSVGDVTPLGREYMGRNS